MRIVFLTSSYYPYFSAIGKCIFNLANELKRDHEIFVISNMSKQNLPKSEKIDDQNVIRIRTDLMNRRDFLSNSDNGLKRKNNVELKIMRLLGYTNALLNSVNLQYDLVNEYEEALKLIEDIDIIIPTCYPFEAVQAAINFKKLINNDVLIVPYLFDKFSDSPTLHRTKKNKNYKYKKHLDLEERMIVNSEKVFYVDSWVKHLSDNFSKYKNKFTQVEHPLIIDYRKNQLVEIPPVKNNYIDIVYTGVLDKKVRPPFETLEIISKMITKDNRLRFHFYALGNCNDVLDDFQKRYPENIFNHGQVKSDVAITKIIESNLLLSIGNTDISLIPSKIFEYMSCGKPILHFYNSPKDRVIQLIRDYGMGYSQAQNESLIEPQINDIVDFCVSYQHVNKSFEEVKSTFYNATPEFISDQIKQILER